MADIVSVEDDLSREYNFLASWDLYFLQKSHLMCSRSGAGV